MVRVRHCETEHGECYGVSMQWLSAMRASAVILALLGAFGALWQWSYWRWVDPVPLDLMYVHPFLLTRPADTPARAQRFGRLQHGPGTRAFLYVHYCLRPGADGELRRWWEDETHGVMALETRGNIGEHGCHKRSIEITVPDLPPGEYEVRSSMTYQTNPVRRDRVDYPPVTVEVEASGSR